MVCRKCSAAFEAWVLASSSFEEPGNRAALLLLANVNCLVNIFCFGPVDEMLLLLLRRRFLTASLRITSVLVVLLLSSTKALGDGSSNVKPLCPDAQKLNTKEIFIFTIIVQHEVSQCWNICLWSIFTSTTIEVFWSIDNCFLLSSPHIVVSSLIVFSNRKFLWDFPDFRCKSHQVSSWSAVV